MLRRLLALAGSAMILLALPAGMASAAESVIIRQSTPFESFGPLTCTGENWRVSGTIETLTHIVTQADGSVTETVQVRVFSEVVNATTGATYPSIHTSTTNTVQGADGSFAFTLIITTVVPRLSISTIELRSVTHADGTFSSPVQNFKTLCLG